MTDDFKKFAKQKYGLDFDDPYTNSAKIREVRAHYELMPQDWASRL